MRFAPFFVFVLAVGALFAWLAPDGAADARPRATAVDEHPRAERRERWSAHEAVLPRDDNGHYYARVESDSGSARMLVDTGASVVALTGDDATALGIEWRDEPLRPVARGASGEVLGVPVTLERIAVDGIEARRVRAVVVPEGLAVSLLGQSFLAQVARVEVSGETMVLHD